jgi:c-di-GMP-binding flagellar brake protein YcgR
MVFPPPSPQRTTLVLRDANLPRPVQVSLEGAVLQIFPTGALSRLLGGPQLSVPLATIESVEDDADGHLLIRTSDREIRLEGATSRELGVRLIEAEPRLGETPRVEGMVEVRFNGGESKEAWMRLTWRRLHLDLKGGFGRWQTPLVSILGGELIGIRRDLQLRLADGQTISIAGDPSPALARALSIEGRTHTSEPALIRVPLLGQHKELVANGEGIEIEDQQGKRQLIAWRRVLRLACRNDRRLIVAWDDPQVGIGRWSLESPSFGPAFSQMRDLLIAAQRVFAASPARSETSVERARLAWASAIPTDEPVPPLASLGIRVENGQDLTVGTLMVLRGRMLFLPAGGPGGCAPADQFATNDLLAEPPLPGDPTGAICLRHGDRKFCYIAADGLSYVGRFWERCRAPRRIIDEPQSLERALHRLEGLRHQARVRRKGSEGIEGVVAHLIHRDGAWALQFEDTSPVRIHIGSEIHIEISHFDGIYTFASRALGQLQGTSPREELIGITLPRRIRVYDQRRAPRVRVDLEGFLRVAGDTSTPPVRLQVADLSTGGIGGHSASALPLGDRVEVDLSLQGRRVKAWARVARVELLEEGCRCGLQFEQIRQVDEDRIQRLVIGRQREELAAAA